MRLKLLILVIVLVGLLTPGCVYFGPWGAPWQGSRPKVRPAPPAAAECYT